MNQCPFCKVIVRDKGECRGHVFGVDARADEREKEITDTERLDWLLEAMRLTDLLNLFDRNPNYRQAIDEAIRKERG